MILAPIDYLALAGAVTLHPSAHPAGALREAQESRVSV